MKESYIPYTVTTSQSKQEMVRTVGGGIIENQELYKTIHEAEETFYLNLVDKLNDPSRPDGLIVPFYIQNGDNVTSVVEGAATAKAKGAQTFYRENSYGAPVTVHVNDSLWAIGESGFLTEAVNKAANPSRNGEDAIRLADFFSEQSGRSFYSASSNIFVNLQSGEWTTIHRSLRIGRVENSQPKERLEETFFKRLQKTGAFDLRFIIESGIIAVDSKLHYYHQGFPGESTIFEECNRKIVPYSRLHQAAHGLTL